VIVRVAQRFRRLWRHRADAHGREVARGNHADDPGGTGYAGITRRRNAARRSAVRTDDGSGISGCNRTRRRRNPPDPGYLISLDNGDELIGPLPKVASPVLGDWPNVDPGSW
jgi:hypothetical protein